VLRFKCEAKQPLADTEPLLWKLLAESLQLSRSRNELGLSLARRHTLDVFPPHFTHLGIRVLPDEFHELKNTDELEVESKLTVALDMILRRCHAVCLLKRSFRRPRGKRDDALFADAPLPALPISNGTPLKQQLR
jgi:hypothetical protein